MNVVVIGAGGHARSTCDVLLAAGEHRIVGLLDPYATEGFFSIPLLGGDDMMSSVIREGRAKGIFVALGDNGVRRRLTEQARTLGYEVVRAISPRAVVSPFASVGQGTAIMPGAIINACARVGEGCIINTNASVDHDDVIGDYCHIAPGVTLCGYVTVGGRSFIGAGARVIDRITIGEDVILGAGAVAVRDIPSCVTAIGVPARVKL